MSSKRLPLRRRGRCHEQLEPEPCVTGWGSSVRSSPGSSCRWRREAVVVDVTAEVRSGCSPVIRSGRRCCSRSDRSRSSGVRLDASVLGSTPRRVGDQHKVAFVVDRLRDDGAFVSHRRANAPSRSRTCRSMSPSPSCASVMRVLRSSRMLIQYQSSFPGRLPGQCLDLFERCWPPACRWVQGRHRRRKGGAGVGGAGVDSAPAAGPASGRAGWDLEAC